MSDTTSDADIAGQTGVESKLRERLEKYGSRGIVDVTSSEGAPVSTDAARKLVPAG